MGLRRCVWAFSSCSERGPLLAVVSGLLIAMPLHCRAQAPGTWAPAVAARRLSSCGSQAPEHRISSCGARVQPLYSMWDLPGPGLEPVSPALAGGLPTTAPPGKPPGCKVLIEPFLVRLGRTPREGV